MNIEVVPTTRLAGSVDLPASKSYSVRAFMVAACGGSSCIISPSLCEDSLSAASAARHLGARFQRQGQRWNMRADFARKNLKCIDVKESGTVLRMLLPLVALKNQAARVTGQGTLKDRPNDHLIKALQNLGVSVEGVGPHHGIPIDFSGGEFQGGTISIDGSMSSQFVSALLMACPQIPQDSVIKITGSTVVSTDYITMTLQILKKAGIKIDRKSLRLYKIKGGQKYKGLKSFHVPSDYGLAAFLMAAAALSDSQVTLKGVLNDSFIQADGHIFEILKKLGVKFQKTSCMIKVCGPFRIKGGTFSLKNCPDLLPILSVLALFAQKPIKFCDIAHVRVKESDRISDLCRELKKIGARIDEHRSSMTVYPLDETQCKQGAILDACHDHRLAMAFCILGLKVGLKVEGVECVSKSYPDFFRDMKKVGAHLKKY